MAEQGLRWATGGEKVFKVVNLIWFQDFHFHLWPPLCVRHGLIYGLALSPQPVTLAEQF